MGTPLGPKYIPYNYMDPLTPGPSAGSICRHESPGSLLDEDENSSCYF